MGTLGGTGGVLGRAWHGGAPVAQMDLFKDPIRGVVTDLYDAIFNLLLKLFSATIEQLLLLNAAQLDELEGFYQASTFAYLVILGLFGVSSLGYFQLFPGSEKADPLRIASRAVPATLSLWIVNPPGTGTTFSRGAFAWAMAVTNALSKLFLTEIGGSIGFRSDALADALTGPFLTLVFAKYLGVPAILAVLLLMAALVLRQLVVYVAFGVYPVAIAFWVVDVGVLKYPKKAGVKLLKTSVKLMAGGVLIAAVLSVGIGLIGSGGALFAGGTPPATPAETGGSAAFSTPGAGDVISTAVFKFLVLVVTCVLPVLMIKQMLGVAGQGAAKALSVAVQAVALAATSGASLAGSAAAKGGATAAKAAGSQIAKRGVANTARTVAKKGASTSIKQAAKRAPGAAKKVAKRAPGAAKKAARRTPDVAKRTGKRAARRGKETAEARARGMLDAAAQGGHRDGEDRESVGANDAPKPTNVSTTGSGSSGRESGAKPSSSAARRSRSVRNPSIGSLGAPDGDDADRQAEGPRNPGLGSSRRRSGN